MDKIYFTYNGIHETIKKLSGELEKTDFNPDLIIAIGTGGFIPARMIKTFIKKPILTVGIAYYDEKNKTTDSPQKVQWINDADKRLLGKKILLVDEVDDTRATLGYCVDELLKHNPNEIAVLVLHNKKKKKVGVISSKVQRYYSGLELDDSWICYPWDADDIVEHDAIYSKQKEV